MSDGGVSGKHHAEYSLTGCDSQNDSGVTGAVKGCDEVNREMDVVLSIQSENDVSTFSEIRELNEKLSSKEIKSQRLFDGYVRGRNFYNKCCNYLVLPIYNRLEKSNLRIY